MTRKQRRGVLIGTCLAVLCLAVGLVLFALRDSIVFFYTPSEVAEKHLETGQRFRLARRNPEAPRSRLTRPRGLLQMMPMSSAFGQQRTFLTRKRSPLSR